MLAANCILRKDYGSGRHLSTIIHTIFLRFFGAKSRMMILIVCRLIVYMAIALSQGLPFGGYSK